MLLNQIDVLELLILLITYLIKVCVSNKPEDLNITKNTYHANVNVNLIEENLIQTKSGIMINVDVSVKNIIYVKKIISGILLHTVVKMENI